MTEPMKICAVCRFFDQAEYTLPRGLCKLFDRTVTAKEAACPGFDRAEKLPLSVFCYLLDQLPRDTPLMEACEIIGIRHHGDTYKTEETK